MSHNISVAYQVEHGPMYYIDDVDNADEAFTTQVNDFIRSLPERLQCHVVLVSEYDDHQPIRHAPEDTSTYIDFNYVETRWLDQ